MKKIKHISKFALEGKISQKHAEEIDEMIENKLKAKRQEGFDDATNIWAGKNIKKGIELSKIISEAKEKQHKEIIEKQYELLISCLPEDAENLSTLTSDQAQRLIKCFIKKNPWN